MNAESSDRTLLVLTSYHHRNTETVAKAIADVLDAQIVAPKNVDLNAIQEVDLIGFGSGIYSAKHHETVLELADSLPSATGRKAFIFSTTGAPKIAITDDFVAKNHSLLREKLQAKGYEIVGEFSCAGFNTNSFLHWFGGLNKGRPDADDLDRAREFARTLKQKMSEP